jgi:hypothetical protein
MSLVFKAQYRSGKCPECEDHIEKGDEVSYTADGSLLHAECNYSSIWNDSGLDDWWIDEPDEGLPL